MQKQKGGVLITQNQLKYWSNKETERADLAKERENRRSNMVREAETERANRAKEEENVRSNKAKENETHRSNVASEKITRTNNTWKNTLSTLNEFGLSPMGSSQLANNASSAFKNIVGGISGIMGMF